VTRVGVQSLREDQGSLREALASLRALLLAAREAMLRIAADPAPSSAFTRLATALVNAHLRPFLTTWHTALQLHEADRPDGMSVIEHERRWPRAAEMRSALADLRPPLVGIVEELAELSGSRLLF
jgi:hypothetical protein